MDLAYHTPEEEIAALRHELAVARAQLGTAAVEIEHLRAQLAALRRQQYGQSSERLDAEIAQLELRLEDLEESEAEHQAARPNPAPAAAADRPSRAKAVRKPLPDHLPRETVVHEPEIGVRLLRPEQAGPARRGRDRGAGEDPGPAEGDPPRPAPLRLPGVRGGVPGAGARPADRARPPGPGADRARGGLEILRRPAAVPPVGDPGPRGRGDRPRDPGRLDRPGRLVAGAAGPADRHDVMAQPVLHTDDTPIRTLAPGTGKTRLARFWVYAVDPRPHAGPAPPAAFYRYSADRKGERPREHLAGFSGVMHADAFAGYDALYRPEPGKPPRIQHAACWAHARRKLFEVHEATKSPIAEEALRRIQALYADRGRNHRRSAADRQAERQARSKPLLDDLKTWMEAQRRRVSGKTALGKALRYALSRWEALTPLRR